MCEFPAFIAEQIYDKNPRNKQIYQNVLITKQDERMDLFPEMADRYS